METALFVAIFVSLFIAFATRRCLGGPGGDSTPLGIVKNCALSGMFLLLSAAHDQV
jgi:hypothetical protein